ncbi:MAG: hypothetical protein K9N11_03060 [Lentisphaeria bacterium]|nr:hypothetical protein [Candidatus Neomarinimicrobiota bacterium]MCF7841812.1 hypothetical protein [Lentisphaeria bacterium]
MLVFAEINTHFDFHGNLGWLLLALVLFTAWIWYTHRQAKQAPTTLQGLEWLWILRGISVVLLLLLFFAPEMRFAYSESKEKEVLVLVDNSASMPLAWDEDWDAVREETAQFFNNLSKSHSVRTAAMSNQGDAASADFSQIIFDGESSIFPSKFPFNDMDRFSAVIAFTDGQFNVGPSPLDVEWLKALPIYPVLPAEPKSPEGLKIVELIAPDGIAVSDSLPFQLTWRRMGNLPAELEISVQNETTQQMLLSHSLTQTRELKTFVSKLRFRQPGLQRLNFQLATTDGQFTTNISKTIRVRKSRRHVLLISDVLTPLVTVLQRSLPDSLFSVESLIKSKQGGFVSGKDPRIVNTPDLILLVDHGDLVLNDDTRELVSRVYADSIPTVIFNLNNSQLSTAIPGLQMRGNLEENEFTPFLAQEGKRHPLGILATAITSTGRGESDFWTSLPPLQSGNQILWVDGVRVFEKIVSPEPVPVITLDEKRPLLVLNGTGYWRWFFRPPGMMQFNQYWEQVVTYLLNRKYLKLVSLNLQNEAIHVGEQVPVHLQVRDVQGAPLDQGSVSLYQVEQSNGTSQSLAVWRVAPGLYRSALKTSEKGRYTLIGRAERGGNVWGQDSLEVQVAAYSAETQVTGVNQPLLQRLAANSGGHVLGPDDLNDIRLPAGEYTTWHEFIWPGLNRVWVMFLLILAFGMEWIFRRRMGLM